MTMPKPAPSAPDENHLCALITHSSPSRTARLRKPGRIGARDLRLGHAEERARLPGDERLEELLLLLARAEQVEDLAVAGVGRLAAEDQLRDHAAADLLVQVRVLEEAAARAARLRRQVRRPEAGVLRLLPQLGDERVGRSSSRASAASFG